MDNQESNQPNSGQGCGLAFWLLVVFALTPIFPVAAFMVLLLGLFVLCFAHRSAAVLLGLTLAVACVIGAIVILGDPEMSDAAPTGLLLLPWAGLGLWLAAGKYSKK
ncbi:MAG TPA: hypothetical protein VGR14_04275 [Verrucomicrobiae bacterium]|jgi:hypothetical protein|nr:hypothetical protein [Verrucomicrobiae bacterium]